MLDRFSKLYKCLWASEVIPVVPFSVSFTFLPSHSQQIRSSLRAQESHSASATKLILWFGLNLMTLHNAGCKFYYLIFIGKLFVGNWLLLWYRKNNIMKVSNVFNFKLEMELHMPLLNFTANEAQLLIYF